MILNFITKVYRSLLLNVNLLGVVVCMRYGKCHCQYNVERTMLDIMKDLVKIYIYRLRYNENGT